MKKSGEKLTTAGLNFLSITEAKEILWNLSPAELVEEALCNKEGVLTNTGALMCDTGKIHWPFTRRPFYC